MAREPGVARALRVAKKTVVADGVVEIVLVDAEGGGLPSWEPGAHVVLHLAEGLRRHYSLCGADRFDGTWTIAVHRAPASRGGSAFVHDTLRPDAELDVVGPLNDFPLEEAERVDLVAGGIGVTPIIAMVRSLRDDGADFRFVYCGRTRALMAYLAEVESWNDDRVLVHVDDEQGGRLDLAAWMAVDPEAVLYCCGPEPMIAFVENAIDDPSRLRVERFVAPEFDTAADTAFDVVDADSGRRVRIDADRGILETLEGEGYDLPNSCREGVCGTCETAVVGGVPDHRDSVLTEAERAANDVMMICCSRSRGEELVLRFSRW
ncbi:PDR/VanB family oxidoreductase [Umezawaea sp. NPDC059074]|uniref:PDR/VanB family oxidoreductase n=1 Tax=Umezawaea sp. NPDC059074 TaxID=3346716 RepID=UPI00368EB7B4